MSSFENIEMKEHDIIESSQEQAKKGCLKGILLDYMVFFTVARAFQGQ
jgi:hypothetical protein